MYITNGYLVNEEKVVLATSKVEAVEAKSLKLRMDMISLMNEANVIKGKLKALIDELEAGKLLIVRKDGQLQFALLNVESAGAKAVQAFQTIEEYSDILFLYYFKGFELLRCYLTKHNLGVNLDGMDFEAIDKEIIVNEAVVAEAAVVATAETVDKSVGVAGFAVDNIPGVDELPRDDGAEAVVGEDAPSA